MLSQDVNHRIYSLSLGSMVSTLRQKQGISQQDFARQISMAISLGMSAADLDRRVDEAYVRATSAAQSVLSPADETESFWDAALAIAGIVAIAGLVGFAVAALINEENRAGSRPPN